ncbi:hypothetical protein ACLB2K_006289 [Fragaria x ananassa]
MGSHGILRHPVLLPQSTPQYSSKQKVNSHSERDPTGCPEPAKHTPLSVVSDLVMQDLDPTVSEVNKATNAIAMVTTAVETSTDPVEQTADVVVSKDASLVETLCCQYAI